MRKMKKLIALGLSMVMCCSVGITSYASENKVFNDEENLELNAVNIEKDTLESDVMDYDMPKEVAEYISEVFEENEKAEVTVYVPEPEISTFATTSSWGKTRTYKGYKLQDWNVKVTNAFDMVKIKTGKNATGFAETIIGYVAGYVADKIVPFGSTGITVAQFFYGNINSVRAASGDKLNAAPKYTSTTKFTYVYVDGNKQLGARTQTAKLETISWYYYNEKDHKEQTKTRTYNWEKATISYENPDAKAISGFANGGYLEDSISIKIGGKYFILD